VYRPAEPGDVIAPNINFRRMLKSCPFLGPRRNDICRIRQAAGLQRTTGLRAGLDSNATGKESAYKTRLRRFERLDTEERKRATHSHKARLANLIPLPSMSGGTIWIAYLQMPD
jgi:hypothetical protein